MKRGLVLLLIVPALLIVAVVFSGVLGSATVEDETSFIVPAGSSLTSVAEKLEDEGLISSANGFLLRAKLFGGSQPIQAGEFLLTPEMGQDAILDAFQNGDVIRRFVTVPEGMPSILVYEKLMAEEHLTGTIPVPAEGSVLPDTYDFERGEPRTAVLARMQAAMQNYLAEAWPKRGPDIAVSNVRDAVILASIVEKETGVARERRMVAGLYSNRVKEGMFLQADPTIIYPITNPGRESIAAVLNPAKTDALYMVADGTGGHEFNKDYAAHQRAVDKWFALRRERGEM